MDQDEQRGNGNPERNDRVIVAPSWHDRLGAFERVADLPERLRQEIEQFFLSATFFTAKNLKVLGWKGPKKASRLSKRVTKLI
jgi:inorganic pyrophosphatase